MKKMTVVLTVLLFCIASVALAVPANKTITFDKAKMGPVEFSGKIHKDAGFKCKDCHNKEMFPKMKKGTVEIKMKEIYAGKYCGKCHNGERAFAAKKNCKRCHVKK
jgi:c(7)-type cytochrome triheme protein